MSIASRGHHTDYLARIANKYSLLTIEELNSEIRKMRDEVNRRQKSKASKIISFNEKPNP